MGGHDLTWITKVENGNVHQVLEQTITVNIVFKGIYDAIIYPKDDCNFFPRKSEYPDTIQFFTHFLYLEQGFSMGLSACFSFCPIIHQFS